MVTMKTKEVTGGNNGMNLTELFWDLTKLTYEDGLKCWQYQNFQSVI
jgi:hypothetical protein